MSEYRYPLAPFGNRLGDLLSQLALQLSLQIFCNQQCCAEGSVSVAVTHSSTAGGELVADSEGRSIELVRQSRTSSVPYKENARILRQSASSLYSLTMNANGPPAIKLSKHAAYYRR